MLAELSKVWFANIVAFGEALMSRKRRSSAGLSPAERRKLDLKELDAKWDRRLSVLNKPDAHKRLDAVLAAEGHMKRRPKAGPTY